MANSNTIKLYNIITHHLHCLFSDVLDLSGYIVVIFTWDVTFIFLFDVQLFVYNFFNTKWNTLSVLEFELVNRIEYPDFIRMWIKFEYKF